MATLLFYNGEPTPEADIRADMSKQGVDKKTVQLFLDTAEFFDTPANFFDESKVKRGQPGNAGQFGPGGGSAAKKSGKSKKPADAAEEKKVAPQKADGEEKAIELGPEAIVDPVARRDAEDAQDREIYAKQGGEALKQHLAKRKALKQAEAKEKESGEGVIDLADYEKSEKAKSGQKKPGDNDAGGSFIGKKPVRKSEYYNAESERISKKLDGIESARKARDSGKSPPKKSGYVKRVLGLDSQEDRDHDNLLRQDAVDAIAHHQKMRDKHGFNSNNPERLAALDKEIKATELSKEASRRNRDRDSDGAKVLQAGVRAGKKVTGVVASAGKKVVDKVKSLFYNGEPTPISDVRFSLLSEGFDESVVDDWLLTFEVASFADDEDEDRASDGKFAPKGSGDKTEGEDGEEEDVVTKTVKKVKKTADEAGETAEKAGTAASKGAGDVVDKVKKSAEDIGETVSKTSQKVADAASEETSRLTKPLRDAADYVADSAVGRGVKSGVEKVGKSLSAAGDAASEAASRTGTAISEGASAVKRKAKNAVSRIRSLFYNGEPTPIADVRFSLLDNGFDPAVVDDWLLTFEVAEFFDESKVNRNKGRFAPKGSGNKSVDAAIQKRIVQDPKYQAPALRAVPGVTEDIEKRRDKFAKAVKEATGADFFDFADEDKEKLITAYTAVEKEMGKENQLAEVAHKAYRAHLAAADARKHGRPQDADLHEKQLDKAERELIVANRRRDYQKVLTAEAKTKFNDDVKTLKKPGMLSKIKSLLFHGKEVPIDTVRNAYLKVGFTAEATEEILSSMEVVDFFDESQPRGKDGKWKKGAGGSNSKTADAAVADRMAGPAGSFQVKGVGNFTPTGKSRPYKEGLFKKLKKGVAGAFRESEAERESREAHEREVQREKDEAEAAARRAEEERQEAIRKAEEKRKEEEDRIAGLQKEMEDEIKATTHRIMNPEDQRGIIARAGDRTLNLFAKGLNKSLDALTLPFDFAGQAKIADTIGNFFTKDKSKYRARVDKNFEYLKKEYGETTANLIVAGSHLIRVGAVAGVGIAATAAISPAGLTAAGVGGTITALLGGSGKMALARAATSVMLAGGGVGALARVTDFGKVVSRVPSRLLAWGAYSWANKKYGSEIDEEKEVEVKKAAAFINDKFAALSGGRVGIVPDSIDREELRKDALPRKKKDDDDAEMSGWDRSGVWRRNLAEFADPKDDQVTLPQADIDKLSRLHAKLIDQSLLEALLADKKVWQELADAIIASGVSKEELLKHDPMNKA